MQAKLHIFRVLVAGWMALIFLPSSQSRLPGRGHFGAKLYERIHGSHTEVDSDHRTPT